MHLVAAQILLADLLAQRALHQRRPAREHLRRAPHHHREMAGRHLRRRQPRHRAQRRRDHRHLRHQLPPALRPIHLRQIRAPHLRRRADVRPEAVDQPNQRQLQLDRHLLRIARLVAATAVYPQLAPLHLRAALQPRRVVGAPYHHRPPVDPRRAHHRARRQKAHQLAVLVEARPRQRPALAERAFIRQQLDPLAHCQPTQLVLLPHPFRPAHPPRQLAPPLDLRNLRLPAHSVASSTIQTSPQYRAPTGPGCLPRRHTRPASIVPAPLLRHSRPRIRHTRACRGYLAATSTNAGTLSLRHFRSRAGDPYSGYRRSAYREALRTGLGWALRSNRGDGGGGCRSRRDTRGKRGYDGEGPRAWRSWGADGEGAGMTDARAAR